MDEKIECANCRYFEWRTEKVGMCQIMRTFRPEYDSSYNYPRYLTNNHGCPCHRTKDEVK